MKKGLSALLITGVAVSSWAIGAGQMYFGKDYLDIAVSGPEPPPIVEPVSVQERNNYPINKPLNLWAPQRPNSISGSFYAFDGQRRPYLIDYDGVESTMSIRRASLMVPLEHEFASTK